VALGFGLGLARLPAADAPTNAPVRARRPFYTNSLPPLPEPTTVLEAKSPVAIFRELLVMTPAERIKSLADRPPETRKLIMAKVREYLSLKPSDRELRLKVTELRWYLWPMMHMAATNRTELLARVPAEDRSSVEGRLQEWDKLPADVQKELLENEATIRYFIEQQRTNSAPAISEARQKWLERGVQQWQKLPEEQRQKMVARFSQFFDLTPSEKGKALGSLSEQERQQIEKTLHQFDRLPPQQRWQCIRSFEKFTSLSIAERQQFLKNAEYWKRLSPEERQAWTDLVEKTALLPPMPPGTVPPPRPPRITRPAGAAPVVATNQD
jgi:hypothetical protein